MGAKYTVSVKTDMNMKLADFVEVYFRDKEGELKQRTIRNKRYMIEYHIIPLLGNKAMDSITPADIIQWQNEIQSKGFKETYQRMLQNCKTKFHPEVEFSLANEIYAILRQIQMTIWVLCSKINLGNYVRRLSND